MNSKIRDLDKNKLKTVITGPHKIYVTTNESYVDIANN